MTICLFFKWMMEGVCVYGRIRMCECVYVCVCVFVCVVIVRLGTHVQKNKSPARRVGVCTVSR